MLYERVLCARFICQHTGNDDNSCIVYLCTCVCVFHVINKLAQFFPLSPSGGHHLCFVALWLCQSIGICERVFFFVIKVQWILEWVPCAISCVCVITTDTHRHRHTQSINEPHLMDVKQKIYIVWWAYISGLCECVGDVDGSIRKRAASTTQAHVYWVHSQIHTLCGT